MDLSQTVLVILILLGVAYVAYTQLYAQQNIENFAHCMCQNTEVGDLVVI